MLALAPFLMAGQLFFVEAQPGAEAGEEPAVGGAFGLEMGAGGSWAGSRPRFFLVARYEHAAIEYAPEGALRFRSQREYDDLAAGLRILLPIVEPVRIYGEGLVGASFTDATLDRPGLAALDAAHTRAIGQAAFGVQLRLHQNFSVGMRIQQTWLDHSPDVLAALVGERLDTTRTTVAATLGVHF
jgi:hypothetical protein